MTDAATRAGTERPRKVVVWGLGNVGVPALRTVVHHPELELAGVIVHGEHKEGMDAGVLAGLPSLGVAATRDVQAVLGERPDALVYAATQDMRPEEAMQEMTDALRCGVNVVTAGTYGLLHPKSADPTLRERFEGACKEGGSSFLTSGIDPGFALDLLPMIVSGVCERFEEVRIVENFNYATYDVPPEVRAVIGFGAPMDQPPLMLLPGIPTSVWGPAIRGLAEALELPLDDVREVIERHPLERTVEARGTLYEAGTQGAFRFEVQGIVGGRPALVLEHITRIVDDTAPQWPRAEGMGFHQVKLTGHPNITLTIEAEDASGDHVAGGNATAAARIVSCIPWVCDAEAGLLSAIDAPLVTGRGRLAR